MKVINFIADTFSFLPSNEEHFTRRSDDGSMIFWDEEFDI
jgi:hypothetical protein